MSKQLGIMEREIKFRAWYGNQMVEHAESMRLLYNNSSPIPAFHVDALFMQYTGLKDKNDVEIYGGDIFTNTNGQIKENGEWSPNIKGPYLCDVIWRIRPLYDSVSLISIEVIGNIHQNPELLKS